MIDLCPFLASDKIQYDDNKVLNLLRRNPRAACLRATFHRFGIGNDLHPLALVVALGGSLDVVKIMVEVCPEALEERLSGRRTLLHYAISEGVDVEVSSFIALNMVMHIPLIILMIFAQVIKYLVSHYPGYLTETDSYNAIPLHLAASYPSTSVYVLKLLLDMHPNGAKALDNQSMTPLHRACKSRASLQKVKALVESDPNVLSWRDWCGNTPLSLADRMDHRLGDVIPEVVGLLELVEEVMRLGLTQNNSLESPLLNSTERRQRASEILARFRFIEWKNGLPMAFAYNIHLFNLMAIPEVLIPKFLALFSCISPASSENDSAQRMELLNVNSANRLNTLYSLLKHQPLIICKQL